MGSQAHQHAGMVLIACSGNQMLAARNHSSILEKDLRSVERMMKEDQPKVGHLNSFSSLQRVLLQERSEAAFVDVRTASIGTSKPEYRMGN